MKRFFVTGAPGAGKTAIIRRSEIGTAEPWRDPLSSMQSLNFQRDRQIRASYQPDEVQFHDRSVACTAALAVYLDGHFRRFLPAN